MPRLAIRPSVRHVMLPRDADSIAKLEDGLFPYHWTTADVTDYIRPRSGRYADRIAHLAYVGTIREAVVCWWAYRVCSRHIALDRLVVSGLRRRQGIGSRVIEGLRSRLDARRPFLLATIPEHDADTVPTHLARELGEDLVAVVELDAEVASLRDQDDLAVEMN